MLENILSSVKDIVAKEVLSEKAIPQGKENAVVDTIMDTLGSKLGKAGEGFDLGSIASLFGGGGSSSSHLSSSLVTSLMDKVGLDNPTAQGLVSSLLPKVMSFFDKDGNDGEGGGLKGLLGKIGL